MLPNQVELRDYKNPNNPSNRPANPPTLPTAICPATPLELEGAAEPAAVPLLVLTAFVLLTVVLLPVLTLVVLIVLTALELGLALELPLDPDPVVGVLLLPPVLTLGVVLPVGVTLGAILGIPDVDPVVAPAVAENALHSAAPAASAFWRSERLHWEVRQVAADAPIWSCFWHWQPWSVWAQPAAVIADTRQGIAHSGSPEKF